MCVCAHEPLSAIVAMLAMCVRKTADTTHPVTGICPMGAVQPSGSGSAGSSSKRKHKPFKGTKTRSSKEDRRERGKEEERLPSPKVQDDDDGHLIYRKGDVLESRCEFDTGTHRPSSSTSGGLEYLDNMLYSCLCVDI